MSIQLEHDFDIEDNNEDHINDFKIQCDTKCIQDDYQIKKVNKKPTKKRKNYSFVKECGRLDNRRDDGCFCGMTDVFDKI